MKIGTPLSPSATRVMLLGSGELGKEVIIALQRLGVEVIAVDRYAHAPGHQVAHRAHVINMADGAALRALIGITGLYLVLGGYFAITLTDFFQGLIMLVGSALMIGIVI